MISHRLIFVGLHVLLLAYTAQSIMLITANMNDVRRITRNFVPDSVADKLIEFVLRTIEHVKTQNEETEGDNNFQVHEATERNKYEIHNIARQRKENKERLLKTKASTKRSDGKEKQEPNYIETESSESSSKNDATVNDNRSGEKQNQETWIGKSLKKLRNTFSELRKQPPVLVTPKKDLTLKRKEMPKVDTVLQKHLKPSLTKQHNENNVKGTKDNPEKPFDSYYEKSHKNLNENHYKKLTAPDLLTTRSVDRDISIEKPDSDAVDGREAESDETPSLDPRYKRIKKHSSKLPQFHFISPKHRKPIQPYDRSPEVRFLKNKNQDYKNSELDYDKSIDFKSYKKDLGNMRFRAFDEYDAFTTEKEKTDFDQYENHHYSTPIDHSIRDQLILSISKDYKKQKS